MKTFIKYLIGKVLKYLAESNTDDLVVVLNLVTEAATRFASTQNTEKFNFVLKEAKKIFKDKQESAIRYLIETAVRLAKKNSQI